jgi:hypothetical protein
VIAGKRDGLAPAAGRVDEDRQHLRGESRSRGEQHSRQPRRALTLCRGAGPAPTGIAARRGAQRRAEPVRCMAITWLRGLTIRTHLVPAEGDRLGERRAREPGRELPLSVERERPEASCRTANIRRRPSSPRGRICRSCAPGGCRWSQRAPRFSRLPGSEVPANNSSCTMPVSAGRARLVRAREGIAVCGRPWWRESWRGSAGRAPP